MNEVVDLPPEALPLGVPPVGLMVGLMVGLTLGLTLGLTVGGHTFLQYVAIGSELVADIVSERPS